MDNGFMNEKQKTPVDELYSILRKRILNETYLPGEKLSETLLGTEFECSRTPIREALKRLERDGLIDVQPKSGSYVKIHGHEDNKNLMEMRAYIEGLSVRLIIENGTGIAPLKKILSEMDSILKKSPIDMIAFGERHYEFHHSLVRLSGNALGLQVFERLNLKSAMFFYKKMDEKMASRTQDEHKKMLALLEAKSATCEKFAIGHLWKTRHKFGT